jgi:hypothetical protein
MKKRTRGTLALVLATTALLWVAGCARPAPAPAPDPAQQDACLGQCGAILPTPLPLATVE